jgi:hypothetical protein
MQKAQEILTAATAELVGLLARKIAFSPNPKSAMATCRVAVETALLQHFRDFSPEERDRLIYFVMERVLASALEIREVDKLGK